jgi:hypothetical protein
VGVVHVKVTEGVPELGVIGGDRQAAANELLSLEGKGQRRVIDNLGWMTER